jgi:hypothetical protein
MLSRSFLFWIPMVFVAILNGIIRNSVYQKYTGELTAHQISTFTAIILFGFYIWLIIPYLKLQSANEAISVGLVWLVLTVAFEFIFGRYITGHTWDELFADYKIWKGRLWILVLVWIVISPYFVFRLRS